MPGAGRQGPDPLEGADGPTSRAKEVRVIL
jgi:hypothetical protein